MAAFGARAIGTWQHTKSYSGIWLHRTAAEPIEPVLFSNPIYNLQPNRGENNGNGTLILPVCADKMANDRHFGFCSNRSQYEWQVLGSHLLDHFGLSDTTAESRPFHRTIADRRRSFLWPLNQWHCCAASLLPAIVAFAIEVFSIVFVGRIVRSMQAEIYFPAEVGSSMQLFSDL